MAVYIVGGGLAGCEAAWQAAKYGAKVKLYEMKPYRFSEAHTSEGLAELVCSNSFKAANLENASGLLKEEMRVLQGLVISCGSQYGSRRRRAGGRSEPLLGRNYKKNGNASRH